MNQASFSGIQFSYDTDPRTTPADIRVTDDLVLVRGTEVQDEDSLGIVTGFEYRHDGDFEDTYRVAVCWYRGPRSEKKETRLMIYNLDAFLKFMDWELMD